MFSISPLSRSRPALRSCLGLTVRLGLRVLSPVALLLIASSAYPQIGPPGATLEVLSIARERNPDFTFGFSPVQDQNAVELNIPGDSTEAGAGDRPAARHE